MRSFRALVLHFDVMAGCSPPAPFSTGYGSNPKHALYTCFLKLLLLFINTQIFFSLLTVNANRYNQQLDKMYLSHSALEVTALSDPKPAWVPGVGGTLYVGDGVIVNKPVNDAATTPIPFKVGQITDVTTSTELKVNWFMTGYSIRDYVGGENNDEEDMCYIAVKTNIYQQVSTSDICSLAYLVHADNKQKLVVDPKGRLNTFTVYRQLILGCDPAVLPIVNKEAVSCAVDIFQKTYPNL
jgi:hypothetical protein